MKLAKVLGLGRFGLRQLATQAAKRVAEEVLVRNTAIYAIARATVTQRAIARVDRIVKRIVRQECSRLKKVESRNERLPDESARLAVSFQGNVFEIERIVSDVGSCPSEELAGICDRH